MKISYITMALIAFAVLGGVIYAFNLWPTTTPSPATETPSAQQDEQKPSGKVMSIESYVTQNITEISTTKAVLGGTWYVTKVEAENGRGTVWYEDGHIAEVADFSYTMSDREGIKITSFVVRN